MYILSPVTDIVLPFLHQRKGENSGNVIFVSVFSVCVCFFFYIVNANNNNKSLFEEDNTICTQPISVAALTNMCKL